MLQHLCPQPAPHAEASAASESAQSRESQLACTPECGVRPSHGRRAAIHVSLLSALAKNHESPERASRSSGTSVESGRQPWHTRQASHVP
eukprot:2708491-Rhodomonas_salina.3